MSSLGPQKGTEGQQEPGRGHRWMLGWPSWSRACGVCGLPAGEHESLWQRWVCRLFG